MFYAMKSFLDEYGKRYERTIRLKGFKTQEKAFDHAKKHGKGSFVINRHRQVVQVV